MLLSGGEIIYFEMDQLGQLLELAKKDMEGDVQAMDLPPVPPGLLRCKFLAVGSFDQTVRILSLEDGTQLRAVATQAVHVSEQRLKLRARAEGGGSWCPEE